MKIVEGTAGILGVTVCHARARTRCSRITISILSFVRSVTLTQYQIVEKKSSHTNTVTNILEKKQHMWRYWVAGLFGSWCNARERWVDDDANIVSLG